MKAILFGGQGSQQVNMGGDFYEKFSFSKDYYDQLDPKLKDLLLKADLETLSTTRNTQPALIAYHTMISGLLKEAGIRFDYTAGLSIGEYGSLAYSGVITPKEAIEIAFLRGQIMEEVVEGIDSKMLAVLGTDRGTLEKACKEVSEKDSFVEISNLNCPGQIVVSGERAAVDRLANKIKDQAKRLIELNTSGPFHTSYLEKAEDKLREVLENYTFKEEEAKVVYNLLAREKQKSESCIDIMSKQVSKPVKFQESIEYLISQGVDSFVEVGFGNVLKGFIKRIDRSKKVYVIDGIDSYLDFINEVKND